MARGTRARLNVGERVGVRFGSKLRLATILEDRGNLGVDGERVYRIVLDDEFDPEPTPFEIPDRLIERQTSHLVDA